MPQATEALRAEWPGGMDEATQHLRARGFQLDGLWQWHYSGNHAEITDRDKSAICYLVDEWDFGGLFEAEPDPIGTELAGHYGWLVHGHLGEWKALHKGDPSQCEECSKHR